MATGGSLSRTGVSVSAGANSRWGGVFAGLWLGVIVLLFGSSAEMVPLAVIGGMLTVVGVELIVARIPSAQLVLRTGEWGPIAALALTFFSALFIPLQFTIFLGAGLSLLLYVVAASRKTRLRQAVHHDDGTWEISETPTDLPSNAITVLIVEGLDFFAEVPALNDQLPAARYFPCRCRSDTARRTESVQYRHQMAGALCAGTASAGQFIALGQCPADGF